MNYIDCHNHFRPGVDDGAQSTEEALDSLRLLRSQGVTKAILTPHVNSPVSRNGVKNQDLQTQFNSLSAWCRQDPDLYPSLALGCEYYFDPYQETLMHPILMAGSRYVLLELPDTVNLDKLKSAEKTACVHGYKVLLAHPEKYYAFQAQWDDALAWLRENPEVKVQIEAWDTAEETADHHKESWRFIEARAAHVLGTDSHGYHRPPVYDRAVNALLDWAGEDEERQAYVRRLTRENAEELFGL